MPAFKPSPGSNRVIGKITGWPPGLLQDDCPGLSKWFAGRMDASHVVRTNIDNDRATMFTPEDIPDIPKSDWEGLREKVKGTIRNVTMMAVLPQEDPPRVVSGTAPGIYPVRDTDYLRNKTSDNGGIRVGEFHLDVPDSLFNVSQRMSEFAAKRGMIFVTTPGRINEPGFRNADAADIDYIKKMSDRLSRHNTKASYYTANDWKDIMQDSEEKPTSNTIHNFKTEFLLICNLLLSSLSWNSNGARMTMSLLYRLLATKFPYLTGPGKGTYERNTVLSILFPTAVASQISNKRGESVIILLKDVNDFIDKKTKEAATLLGIVDEIPSLRFFIQTAVIIDLTSTNTRIYHMGEYFNTYSTRPGDPIILGDQEFGSDTAPLKTLVDGLLCDLTETISFTVQSTGDGVLAADHFNKLVEFVINERITAFSTSNAKEGVITALNLFLKTPVARKCLLSTAAVEDDKISVIAEWLPDRQERPNSYIRITLDEGVGFPMLSHAAMFEIVLPKDSK